MISAIVAVDENWGIGFNGKLLEKIPEDLKYFKKLTINNTMVMGRKTWDSLSVKPLSNRFNIVISRQEKQYEPNSFTWITTLEKCIQTMLNDDIDEYFIIGGGQIYKELLPLCDRVYITKVYKTHENVDTYFPKLDDLEWKIVHESEILTFDDLQYQFLTYDRIN